MQTSVNFPPIYLTIGITGHRDIPSQDESKLKDVIKSKLLNLQTLYKDTPLLVLSGLAEGADRLVVEVAYELGIAFAAILPLPSEDYVNDFSEADSKIDFYLWLERAQWVETLRPDFNNLNCYDRDQCYEQLGFYLARNSQLLMALWDGDKQEKTGGTSQVVRYYLQGIFSSNTQIESGLSQPQYRPVEHILTRRLCHLDALNFDEVGKVNTIWPEVSVSDADWLQKRWERSLSTLGVFNCDMAELAVNNFSAFETSRFYLLGNKEIYSQLDPKAQHIADLFAVSDALSSVAQNHRNSNFLMLVIFALIAVVSQQSYGFFLQWYLLFGSLIFGALSFGLFTRSKKLRLEAKYLDYRALAEALRVQFFWYIGGISASADDYFLCDQRDELEWIRHAISASNFHSFYSRMKFSNQWITERWVKDQRIYFIGDQQRDRPGKARIDAKKEKQLIRRMRNCFFAGFGLMLLSAIAYELTYENLELEWKSLLLNGLLAMSGALLCVVPTIKLYLDTMAYDEHAKRYLRMGQYYAVCEKQLEYYVDDQSVVNNLFFEIGKQSLIETGDWLLLHRQRPVKVPVM
jgi:hypothetical protein